MILGTGIDITQVSRFKKWVERNMIPRFFNEQEILCTQPPLSQRKLQYLCEHYAARFAAKEAFGKALGIGIFGFSLKDVWVCKKDSGAPTLRLENSALSAFLSFLQSRLACPPEYFADIEKRMGDPSAPPLDASNKLPFPQIHISMSHEKEYAIAQVIIDI